MKRLMEGRDHKFKRKKKRKLEDEAFAYGDDKKNKKKSDENAEDVNEGLENAHKHHTKRRRKDSKGEGDWSGRRRSNTELIKVRALNKQEKTVLENDPVTHKKRKKKKMVHEESAEDSGVSDEFTVRKKRKKKKKMQYEERTDDGGISNEFTERKEKKKKCEENMEDGRIRDQLTERKNKYEDSMRDSKISNQATAKKEKKKKSRKSVAEILKSSVESTIPTSSVVEKEKGRENIQFLKPFPVQESRAGGRGVKDTRKEELSYRNQEMREERVPDEEERRGKGESQTDQRRTESYHHRNLGMNEERVPNVEERRGKEDSHMHRHQGINEREPNEEERGERAASHTRRHGEGIQRNDISDNEQQEERAPESVPRLPYSGATGWETDTSTDDLDYSDDCYHDLPYDIRKRIVQTRSGQRWRRGGDASVLYSEGDEIEGFIPDPRLSSDSEHSDWITVEVPPHQRQSPGITLGQRDIPTLEDAMYKFPPGVGIPPEEIEEVKDIENYWVMKDKNLQVSSYAEEAKEYIDDKIHRVEDYFKRIEAGKLTPSEMKETRAENFDEPFFPTPQQLKFLDTLNIKVNWPLEDLHRYHLRSYSIPCKSKTKWQALGLFAETARMTVREEKIIARNWFAFQKEYGFYDLRPLLSVRTALIARENGKMFIQPNNYVSPQNKVHFLLYLAKDLPTRPLMHIYRTIRRLLRLFQGHCLMRKKLGVTGFLLAKFLYVMEVFGADFLAAELLIGLTARNFSHIFKTNIFLRNVKLRIGPWREDEDERFLRGIREVLRVRTFEEAYSLKKVPWVSIFPYVRTRSLCYMRRRLIILASREGEKDNLPLLRRDMARFIRLLYNKHVDSFRHLNWEELAKEVGAANPIRLVWFFRRVYMNYIPYHRRITVAEGLRYMYKNMVPFYEKIGNHHRTPQEDDEANANVPDGLNDLEDLRYLPDPDNPSGQSNTHSSAPIPSSTTDNHSTHRNDPLPHSNPSDHPNTHSDELSSNTDHHSTHSDEATPHSNPTNHPTTHSSESTPHSTEVDHSATKITNRNDQQDTQKQKKVTRKQNDLVTSRKPQTRDPDNLTDPENATYCNVPELRSTQQTHFEDDPSANAFPYQYNLRDNQAIHDLSDSDDDLTSESDSDYDDFEEVMLGQAARSAVTLGQSARNVMGCERKQVE